MLGVESVSVTRAFSHADMCTLEISSHPSTRELMPAVKSMESKILTSYRSYSANVYIQNHWSTTLKTTGKDCTNSNILQRRREGHTHTYTHKYIYIYILKDNTAYGPKYWWYNGAQNKNQKTHKTWNTVRYSVSNKEKPSTIPSRKCNNCIWASVVQLVAKISERDRKC